MSQIDDAAARLATKEAILERISPRLAELKQIIGPWLRATSGGVPVTEPTEARAEYASLMSERWTQARDISATYRELGDLEARSRYLQSRVDACQAEIDRLEALPPNDAPVPPSNASMSEEVARLITDETRTRDSLQMSLDAIGTPRSQVQAPIPAESVEV